MICDWHYERAGLTAAYFAIKGFNVVSCPWKLPAVGVQQVDDMINWRQRETPEIKDRLRGVVQTAWSGVDRFLDKDRKSDPGEHNPWNCFTAVSDEINKQAQP